MQLKRSSAIGAAIALVVSGCQVKTELPIKYRDVQLCSPAATVVATVRDMAAHRRLSFHYGTHPADFGTQETFRLIGAGFELELFNSLSESDFTLRVYQAGGGSKREALEAFDGFRAELESRLSGRCPTARGS